MVIKVKTSTEYDIIIENGSLCKTGPLIREVSDAQKAVVVTDSNVAPLYADRIRNSLRAFGFNVFLFKFKAGEKSKNHNILQELYEFLCENRISRKDLLIALGGGVTGDLTGFAAATFLRGLDFVQIPTTLLAQIDSSVGGKTAVNIKSGKNLVGAFKQPLRVLCDPEVLKTLPAEVFRDGMGEVIKHAAIKDSALFDELIGNSIKNAYDISEKMIYRNIDIKREIVEHDEFENGERRLLNFGHTLAHSAEKLSNYQNLSHGMAVSAGMAMITKASERAGITHSGVYEKLCACLEKYGLPRDFRYDMKDLIRNIINDKKIESGKINLILLLNLGKACIKPLTIKEFENFMIPYDSL
ncbi:MAG: 3-dehydroquinate synthase [Oscillospiraceae bacterium]|nr:3-dehydroquinate synthase [Oscillospiraceae bacterium]